LIVFHIGDLEVKEHPKLHISPIHHIAIQSEFRYFIWDEAYAVKPSDTRLVTDRGEFFKGYNLLLQVGCRPYFALAPDTEFGPVANTTGHQAWMQPKPKKFHCFVD
jgi:hypothetical protein